MRTESDRVRRARLSPEDAAKEGALIGPIQLKDPGSFEFAYQQLYWIKTLYSAVSSTLRDWDGAVEKADQYKIYERLPDLEKPYGSLDAMLKAELGITRDEGRKAIMSRAAEKTNGKVLPPHRPPIVQTKQKVDNLSTSSQDERATKNGVSYQTQRKLDRLARDFPEQHDRVKVGEVTVNRACIEAGFVPPTINLPIVPERAARLLRKHFTGALWTALMDAIEATTPPEDVGGGAVSNT